MMMHNCNARRRRGARGKDGENNVSREEQLSSNANLGKLLLLVRQPQMALLVFLGDLNYPATKFLPLPLRPLSPRHEVREVSGQILNATLCKLMSTFVTSVRHNSGSKVVLEKSLGSES